MSAMRFQQPEDATRRVATDASHEQHAIRPEAAAASSAPSTLPGRLRIPSSRALPISRIDAILDEAWEHRLTLVVAPAGAGKSTLLARFAAAAPGPVAWYRADGWDRDPVRMLRHLDQALRAAVLGIRG